MKQYIKNIACLSVIFALFCHEIVAQPDSALIVKHLTAITKTEGYRNYKNIPLLNQTADYIFSVFSQYADTVYFQPYQVEGNIYKNVVCRLNSKTDGISKPLIIIGAHYDVCGNQEGADDNASGVVGLLELVRLLSAEHLNYPVEFVAYSLEEPPFFRTEHMGSYIHAQSLFDSGKNVYGMVALEMIGYFDERPHSQSYPIKVMKVKYGTAGNFILLAKKTGSGKFVNSFSKSFKGLATINTRSLKAPAKIQGIDFSDHLNYWKFGYDALMVTNTAFYRNYNYHSTMDTMERLDILKMMKVIETTCKALVSMN